MSKTEANRAGIFWLKQDTNEPDYDRDPPYPSYNAMAVVVHTFTSRYVTEQMADAFWQRYRAASDEIIQAHAQLSETETLKKRVVELEAKLAKWTDQQGKGRRQSKKTLGKESEIKSWFDAGLSKSAIARRLNVSEGTIRRILKQLEQ